jgi:hypothetical protein
MEKGRGIFGGRNRYIKIPPNRFVYTKMIPKSKPNLIAGEGEEQQAR